MAPHSMPNYTDLQLRIFSREAAVYPVELTVDGEQHARGVLSADVLPWEPGPDPATEGKRLFETLCAAHDLRDAWIAAQVRSPQRRVRLWLDAPELHALPWELLHDGHTFIAADGATPFSRYVPTSAPWGAPLNPLQQGESKGGILVAIANPADLDLYNLTALDVDAEREVFALSQKLSSVEIDFLDPPVTLARLEEVLQAGYTALHFVGHGVFSQKRQEAALYLQDANGNTVPIPGQDFVGMLTRLAAPPRLTFLSACQSATPGTTRAYLGLGVELVQAGVPAVVAMREAIAIPAEQALSHVFYTRLAEHGAVDLALNEARSHLLTARDPAAAVPALWMRLRSGRVWEHIESVGQTSSLPPRNQAVLVGDGALAHGNHNTVIGARGVYVAGNVGGDVKTGI